MIKSSSYGIYSTSSVLHFGSPPKPYTKSTMLNFKLLRIRIFQTIGAKQLDQVCNQLKRLVWMVSQSQTIPILLYGLQVGNTYFQTLGHGGKGGVEAWVVVGAL